MYYVRRLNGCRSKLLGATILSDFLCKLPGYLLNTSCSCGELNAAIRFGSRLTCAKVNKVEIIYEKNY